MNQSSIIPGRKVYVIGRSDDYANWMQAEIVERMEDASFVVLTGGEDVTPEIYGAARHPTTGCNPDRDRREVAAFKRARALDLPVVGVCRGAQLVCCLAGGKLVQDQQMQPYIHSIDTSDGKRIVGTSSHHQAQWPWNLAPDRFKVIGWTMGLSAYHWGEHDGDEMVIGRAPNEREVEIAVYPHIKSLGIQPHYEWLFDQYHEHPKARESIDYMQDLLMRFLAGTL